MNVYVLIGILILMSAMILKRKMSSETKQENKTLEIFVSETFKVNPEQKRKFIVEKKINPTLVFGSYVYAMAGIRMFTGSILKLRDSFVFSSNVLAAF